MLNGLTVGSVAEMESTATSAVMIRAVALIQKTTCFAIPAKTKEGVGQPTQDATNEIERSVYFQTAHEIPLGVC